VHQVGNQYIVNSWCTVRKTFKLHGVCPRNIRILFTAVSNNY